MKDSHESVISRQPLVIAKQVRWADCDPAGVVYTGRFTAYLLTAVDYFFENLGNGNYFEWIKTLQVDTPCKGLDMEFHRALWPQDWFEMHCSVPTLREHSWDIRIEAVQADGRRVFTGRFSPICISRQVRKRVPIPDPLRAALQRHQSP